MCDICQRTICPSSCPNGGRASSGLLCAHCKEPIEAGETYFRIRYVEKAVHESCADDMTFQEIVALCEDVCTALIADERMEDDD